MRMVHLVRVEYASEQEIGEGKAHIVSTNLTRQGLSEHVKLTYGEGSQLVHGSRIFWH